MRTRSLVLGLGSNLDQPILNLRRALQLLKKETRFCVKKIAPIYESDALLTLNSSTDWQKLFLNSAVLIECAEEIRPLDILKIVKDIELVMGRKNNEKWAPRIIDIDILWIESEEFQSELLSVPHRELFKRPFALLPLLHLKPQLRSIWIEKIPSWAQEWIQERPFNTQVSPRFFWPEFVGILNVTDNSFSDGGLYLNPDTLYHQFKKLLDDGADIIDIGAESTRPQAESIPASVELERLLLAFKVVNELRKEGILFKLSLDCRNSEVAHKIMMTYQVDYLNDVTGFQQMPMQSLLKESKASAFVMHSLSIPAQDNFQFDDSFDPLAELSRWWKDKKEKLLQYGISEDKIIFDPGIGFGKTKKQNLYVLNNLEKLSDMREPVMIGHSRKSFQSLFTDAPAAQRDLETALVTQGLNMAFVQFLRVHEIANQKTAMRFRGNCAH